MLSHHLLLLQWNRGSPSGSPFFVVMRMRVNCGIAVQKEESLSFIITELVYMCIYIWLC